LAKRSFLIALRFFMVLNYRVLVVARYYHRVTSAVSEVFRGAQLNGYDYCVSDFVIRMENITVWLAEGRVSKELLQKLITSMIIEEEYSEELKLELLFAVGDI
ncbi:hypothetical protein, partial [Marinomonas fungiae]